MRTNLRVSLLCGLLCSLIGLPGLTDAEPVLTPQHPQEDAISVEVTSGRTFTGQLSARTDADRLWLQSGQDSAVLLRPIQWDRVVQVHVADRDLSGDEFREIVRTVKPEAPARQERTAGSREIIIAGPAQSEEPPPPTGSGTGQLPETPRVRSLAVYAAAANWDGDVEVDGLLVHVYPQDETGAVIPAHGTIQFDLTGQQEGEFKAWRAPATLGRWTRPVRLQDFGLEGAVYRLPFQNVHPEFDLDVDPHAALHARLSVPGQGTFETTESTLRIRPYSAVRDRLQLSTGRRFFPQERTGQGR
jgi:hypothetical protein